MGGKSVPKPQTQDMLGPLYLRLCPADSQVMAPGKAVIPGSIGRLPDVCAWNSCPELRCLSGASGREVLVPSVAAVGSKAINHAINPFQ